MAEDPKQADSAEESDFGAFLSHRLLGYRAGILGMGSLAAPSSAAAGASGSVIARSTEFNNSLQSLLSHRVAEAAPPPSPERTFQSRSIVSREPAEATTDSEPAAEPAPPVPSAPSAPPAFGTPAWFQAMEARRQSIARRQAEEAAFTGPTAALIETALGTSPGRGGAARSEGDGSIRRRSSVTEMAVATPLSPAEIEAARQAATAQGRVNDSPPAVAPSNQSAPAAPSESTIVRREPEAAQVHAPSPPPAETVESTPTPTETRVAPPIVQRRPGRKARSEPPAAQAANPVPAIPTDRRSGIGEQSDAGDEPPDAPVIRRVVAPTPPPPVASPGRPEAKRVVATDAPRSQAGPIAVTPARTVNVETSTATTSAPDAPVAQRADAAATLAATEVLGSSNDVIPSRTEDAESTTPAAVPDAPVAQRTEATQAPAATATPGTVRANVDIPMRTADVGSTSPQTFPDAPVAQRTEFAEAPSSTSASDAGRSSNDVIPPVTSTEAPGSSAPASPASPAPRSQQSTPTSVQREPGAEPSPGPQTTRSSSPEGTSPRDSASEPAVQRRTAQADAPASPSTPATPFVPDTSPPSDRRDHRRSK